MGVTPDVYSGALGFMRVSFIGLVFNFFFFMFQSVMRGVGEARLPVYIVLGTVILNFVLDPPFIFGWGPIPRFGVEGAALATVSTQSLAALVGLGVLFRGKHGIHLVVARLRPRPRLHQTRILPRVSGLGRAVGAGARTHRAHLPHHQLRHADLAAYGVGSNVLQVVMIPAMGLSMAVSTLVGQNIGARQHRARGAHRPARAR